MADRVSSISPQMCAKLVEKGVRADCVYQLRNWSNTTGDFATADASQYRAQWNLQGRKVALYSGNIANKQGLEIVIEAARLLHARDDIAFVICGEGPNRERLEGLAAGLSNIQFHDLQPAARMCEFLSLASVHLLPQIPGAADLVLPSKLTNMLASGRPVVATASAGTGLYDELDGCGICTPPGDGTALARAVTALIDDPALSAGLGASAARRARERWSQESIIDQLADRLTGLVGNADAARCAQAGAATT
jgi:colanic acid biosynthesis glycosyl transferase WcaI